MLTTAPKFLNLCNLSLLSFELLNHSKDLKMATTVTLYDEIIGMEIRQLTNIKAILQKVALLFIYQ